MDSILFWFENIGSNILSTARLLVHHPIVWGFGIGFGVSTLIHVLIISDKVAHIGPILTKSSQDSYAYLHGSTESNGSPALPFERFKKQYHHIRIGVLSVVLVALLIIIFALVRY